MSRNIVIFSDGTGQAGGLLPDETRSNVYKLFRAARVCPDTSIDPAHQLAFYDPGLGSKSDGSEFKTSWGRWVYNLLSQATGLGITKNIVDCYAAIIRMWQPGDRIFLIGFSRGAYTVRCVAGVLKLCGIPTRAGPDEPLKRDPVSARAIAAEAVKHVYQFGSSIKGDPYREVRRELADRFRERHASAHPKAPERSNGAPYFIGVWDTVAALGLTVQRILALGAAVVLVVAILAGMADLILSRTSLGRHVDISLFWRSFWTLLAVVGVGGLIAYLVTHVKFATGVSTPWWKTLHITGWRMEFYDTELDPNVRFARHALSIDENRKDFDRVKWTSHGQQHPEIEGEAGLIWLKQVWFAGVHSDVGGSYAENDSRLSDIALDWMTQEFSSLPHPLLVDRSTLHLWPSSDGPQHDERKSTVAGWPRWVMQLLTRFWRPEQLGWTPGIRQIPKDAPLHPTVLERFRLPAILAYDEMVPYRPIALQGHEEVADFYSERVPLPDKNAPS
ncbi:MAG TPA: DUF2235 domain-containing protein [Beijerinckiaceae bacterium]|jgi:uncharacterized protein (DUF2235 family)